MDSPFKQLGSRLKRRHLATIGAIAALLAPASWSGAAPGSQTLAVDLERAGIAELQAAMSEGKATSL